jgi:hypothetical protein
MYLLDLYISPFRKHKLVPFSCIISRDPALGRDNHRASFRRVLTFRNRSDANAWYIMVLLCDNRFCTSKFIRITLRHVGRAFLKLFIVRHHRTVCGIGRASEYVHIHRVQLTGRRRILCGHCIHTCSYSTAGVQIVPHPLTLVFLLRPSEITKISYRVLPVRRYIINLASSINIYDILLIATSSNRHTITAVVGLFDTDCCDSAVFIYLFIRSQHRLMMGLCDETI